MSLLDIKSRQQIVTDEINAIQAAAPNSFIFTVGSIIRALVEAHARIAIWEESLIQFVLARTRLSTSQGQDADSFVEDFGFSRPPATFATTNVVFTSIDTSQLRTIPAAVDNKSSTLIGTKISAVNNGPQYVVTIDTSNVNYNPSLQAYTMQPGIASITVPVEALSTYPGSTGNAQLNTITVINSPVTAVDTVNNPVIVNNGIDSASDSQLRVDFVNYLNSLSRATNAAILFAVGEVPGVTNFSATENIDYTTGEPHDGYFYVVADNGAMILSPSLQTAIVNSVENYRGFTIAYEVKALTPVLANINSTIVIPSEFYNQVGFNDALVALVKNNLGNYIKLIPVGETLFYVRIPHIIYQSIVDTVGSVVADQFNITGITLNGGTADLPSNLKSKLYGGSIVITPSSS